MKVKCVPEYTKDQICLAYNNKALTLKELSDYFKTSTRTIGRVLEERGLATPVPRLKGEAYLAMQVLGEYGVTAAQLRPLLEAVSTQTPLSPDVQAVMQIVKSYNMSPDQLRVVLAAPAFTIENVQRFLNQSPKEDLAKYFYTSGLVKLAEIAQQVQTHAQASQPTHVQSEHTSH